MRLVVIIETGGTDLSTHKHVALLEEAFKKYYNWAVTSVRMIVPEEVQILPTREELEKRNSG